MLVAIAASVQGLSCSVAASVPQTTVLIGEAFRVEVQVCASDSISALRNLTTVSYLDGLLWGAPGTLTFSLSPSTTCDNTTLLIPAPVEPGAHKLQLATLNNSLPSPFQVGLPLLPNVTCAFSASISVSIELPSSHDQQARRNKQTASNTSAPQTQTP